MLCRVRIALGDPVAVRTVTLGSLGELKVGD
jgi:hypothetical protein